MAVRRKRGSGGCSCRRFALGSPHTTGERIDMGIIRGFGARMLENLEDWQVDKELET